MNGRLRHPIIVRPSCGVHQLVQTTPPSKPQFRRLVNEISFSASRETRKSEQTILTAYPNWPPNRLVKNERTNYEYQFGPVKYLYLSASEFWLY